MYCILPWLYRSHRKKYQAREIMLCAALPDTDLDCGEGPGPILSCGRSRTWPRELVTPIMSRKLQYQGDCLCRVTLNKGINQSEQASFIKNLWDLSLQPAVVIVPEPRRRDTTTTLLPPGAGTVHAEPLR